MKKQGIEERFWSKVNIRGKNDCWNWIAGGRGEGYGALNINNKIIDSHRVAWILINGEIPNNLYVLHRCNNRACCNPSHLYLGTQSDNMKDAYLAGINIIVTPRGENNHLSKLKSSEVSEIRNLLSLGKRCCEICKEFNVNKRTISDIKNGRTWKILK